MNRFYDTLPAILAWGTLILLALFSWLIPSWVAIFIILFDIYWLLKTLYLSFHLRVSFSQMRTNAKIDWLSKLRESKKSWDHLYHLVILPMHDEPLEVVRDSFLALKNANYPKDKFITVLGLEERAGEKAQIVGKQIQDEFGNEFGKFLITTHPTNLPGEISGKGSNETWAGKEVKSKIIDPMGIAYENIITSVFDVDTQVPSEYFGCLTNTFINSDKPLNSSFQPIPLFTNNIYQAPALARIVSFSSTFWHMMQQARPEQLTTFSSHSLSFKALVDIGFWNTNVVSEDSQIFWQCYFRYDGDWRVEPLFFPIMMDANTAPTFWKTMINIYKQQRRWAWGVENVSYTFKKFKENKIIPLKSKIYWKFKKTEAFWSWATNALMIFALGWLPLIIGGDEFRTTILSYQLPRLTRDLLLLANIGIVSSAILSMLLLPPKPDWLKWWHYPLYLLHWILMPVTLIVFGSIPALEAQTRLALGGKFRLGFWVTPKHRVGKVQMANSE